jgi:O-antigen/teichoic acid export membrane protein
MSKFRKLAGQAATYGISSIVGRVINFLLVPFYTNPGLTGINLADFGVYTELYANMAFLNIIYLFGLETTFFRFSTKDKLNQNQVYSNIESSLIITSTILSGFIILFSGSISAWLGYPDKQSYIILLAVILFVDAIVAIPFARLRLNNQAVKFATLKFANILLNVFFNLFFLLFCRKVYLQEWFPALKPFVELIYMPGYEVGYIVLSNLLANVLQIPFLIKQFKEVVFRLDFQILKPIYKYAYPLMFMGLAGMVNEVMDRILLRIVLPDGFYPNLSTIEAIGIYGACYKLSMFMSLTIQAFRYAAEPFFFNQAGDKNAPKQFALVMKYFIIFCSIIYVVVSCNLSVFGQILRDPVFRQGILIVPFLLLANLFLGIYINLSVWYKLTDKTYAGTVITFLGAAITLVSNFLLIPIWGYMGAAITTLFCYAGMAIIAYIWGQKHYPIPYQLGSALFYLILSSLFIWLSINVINLSGINGIIMGIGISVLYIAVIGLVEFKSLKRIMSRN